VENTFYIENCTFIKNYALFGGAISMFNINKNSSLLNSQFLNNIANQSGGGLYIQYN